jgi:hypothetical protein
MLWIYNHCSCMCGLGWSWNDFMIVSWVLPIAEYIDESHLWNEIKYLLTLEKESKRVSIIDGSSW